MLRRARRLRGIFNEFCVQYNRPNLALDCEEWRQIDYLLIVTQPFFQFTSIVSKTKDVTVHGIFSIYNRLLDHLEVSIRQLRYKKLKWKRTMMKALQAAETKLRQYYAMTDDIEDDLFAIGTILAPQHKLQFFSGKDWEDPDVDYCEKYRQSLLKYLQPYQIRISSTQSNSPANLSKYPASDFDMIATPTMPGRSKASQYDELTKYLACGSRSPCC